MAPLEAALVVVVLVIPFHWAIQREFSRETDPAFLRERGVVVLDAGALDDHAGVIGTFAGREIWATVTFFGMVYRYVGVARAGGRDRVGSRELYLEPGLLYRTD